MLIDTPSGYSPKGKIIERIDNLTSEEFGEMKQRHSKMGYFSASMTPSLLGIYGSAVETFKNMRSDTPLDFSGNVKVLFGQLAESWVGERASNILEVDIFKEPYILGENNHPWVTATKDFHVVDNPIFSGRWAMEVKTTASWNIRKQLGEHLSQQTASSYYTQCQHQMLVDELDGVLNAVMIIRDDSGLGRAVDAIQNLEKSGNVHYSREMEEIMEDIPHEIRCFVIPRNNETCSGIMEMLSRMREVFLRGEYPSMDGSAATGKVLRSIERSEGLLEADEETYELVNEALELKYKGKQYLDESKRIENELLHKLGSGSGFRWKGMEIFNIKNTESNRIDVINFRNDHPELAEQYTKLVTGTRVSY